jgi:kynurenine formamidase
MRFVDLSHTIEDGMITYQGLPAPVICDFYSREQSKAFYREGVKFQIGQVEMVGNTGTYLDCPFHRYEHGKDFSELFLNKIADLDGLLIKVHHQTSIKIGIKYLDKLDVEGKAVLFQTGWDQNWRQDNYSENHPYLTAELATYLRDNHAALVGIDSYNIDDTRTKDRPVHTILLAAGICIVEHMCNMHLLPASGFKFSAVPPKIKGMGSWPVRAYAKML